jgi:hypothetical protein
MRSSVEIADKKVSSQIRAMIIDCYFRISDIYVQIIGPKDRLNPTMWMKMKAISSPSAFGLISYVRNSESRVTRIID